MSTAGRLSTLGDKYQLRVALHWLIHLLEDDSIHAIQVDSTGIPGQDFAVTVDDVVVLYKDGRACFIQAKKNQPDHKAWSLSDAVLKKEIQKTCKQLESRENSEVRFYSRSLFGELKALVETCRLFPDYPAFLRENNQKQLDVMKRLASIMERSEENTFILVHRISFGPTYEFEDWDRQNLQDLDRVLPRAASAKSILEHYLDNHASTLRGSKYLITREDILAELSKHGLSPTPYRSETEILEAFKLTSSIGRNWLRKIDGKPIPRDELTQLMELIEQGSKTILLTDRPGSGKTCLLLDLADELEKPGSPYGLLFIKGDQFTEIDSEQDLAARKLPDDIVGQCARLAGFRRVVIVFDSLDILSLNRHHHALKVFLGLMDRLEKVENVTVVAACRNFDLKYDPLLRGRIWQKIIHLQPLDFEAVVQPFLINKWKINPSSLSPELCQLLQLPQHLRIYGTLAKLGKGLNPVSAYELYNSFLEEVVVQNPLLGNDAMVALQSMAEYLMQQRSQSCSKMTFKADEEVVRYLISQEVLWKPSPGNLSFSHQTLSDCLIVCSALAKSETLTDFILAYPQFPFIRPAVRAFFFFLRAHQPDHFGKQVRQVLDHNEIVYHVKRLICESLAEIIPTDDDWRLLRRIFQNYPDLFRRLLGRVEIDVWFSFLQQYWLAEAHASEHREDWLRQFCWKLSLWVNQYPTEVIALWREAIVSGWVNQQNLIGTIHSGLENLKNWNTEGIRELLEILVQTSNSEQKDFFGRTLSQWVQETNSGDDLLWQYITKNVSPEHLQRWDLRDKLYCLPAYFHDENFLEDRLKKSDQLLILVLADLERWSQESSPTLGYEERTLRDKFLHDTSWRFKHHRTDIHPVDSLTELLSGLETAFKHHASQNSTWWKEHEPYLRNTSEAALRYLTIQAYNENIQTNIVSIESLFQDQALFAWDEMNYELGELMQAAYPYMSDSAQAINQTMILSLYPDPPSDLSESERSQWIVWNSSKIYDLLIRIPNIFRTPEAQSHIDQWQMYLGYHQPSPEIHMWGGLVISPISKENLLVISDEALLRLLHYYQKYPHRKRLDLDQDLIGGFSEIMYVLGEACSLHPMRFLSLFPAFMPVTCTGAIYALLWKELLNIYAKYRTKIVEQI